VLIPFYLLVVYGGFHLWQLFMEKYPSHGILAAVALGVMQAVVFLLLVLVEYMIAGGSVGYNQFMLAVTLCAYVGIGFLLISITTTLQYQKNKRARNYV